MVTRMLVVAVAASLTSATLAQIQPQPKAGAPLPGLTAKQRELFNAGKIAYGTTFNPEDGLGPIMNKAGCFSCHSMPLGGWGSISVTHFGIQDKGMFSPLPGETQSLLQALANSEPCAEVIPPEANYTATRLTNSSMAFGLIEAIDDNDIAANNDPTDLNSDGIRGRIQWVHTLEDPEGPLRAGRFGWKAQVATVLTFSGDATRNEMGITNRLVPDENPPNGNYELLKECDELPDPEDGPDGEGFDFIDRVTHFQRYLAQPPQTPKSGMYGESVFNSIGCNQCHIPSWQTRDDRNLESAIRNKTIRPYADFLLHDMGLLGDGIAQAGASELEMRTPTLWNLRTRDPMLHNGMAAGGSFASRVTTAIQAHGPYGEGAASASAFDSLSPTDRDALVDFLNSLGRLEFDSDGDGDVDHADFDAFAALYGSATNPNLPSAVHDIDQDGDIDLDDFGSFELAFEGINGDCDDDGMSNLKEILLGNDTDTNHDGVPDNCPACVTDLNGDKITDGADLGTLLGYWGQSKNPADLNGDDNVDGADLGILLGGWGPCP